MHRLAVRLSGIHVRAGLHESFNHGSVTDFCSQGQRRDAIAIRQCDRLLLIDA